MVRAMESPIGHMAAAQVSLFVRTGAFACIDIFAGLNDQDLHAGDAGTHNTLFAETLPRAGGNPSAIAIHRYELSKDVAILICLEDRAFDKSGVSGHVEVITKM